VWHSELNLPFQGSWDQMGLAPRAPPSLPRELISGGFGTQSSTFPSKGANIRRVWHPEFHFPYQRGRGRLRSTIPLNKGAREGEFVFPELRVRWAEYRTAPSFPPKGACSSGWGTQKSPVPSHECWNMSVYPAVPILLSNQVKLAQGCGTQEPILTS
jgi:hypothetical protein